VRWLEPAEAFRMLLVFRMLFRPLHPQYTTFADAIKLADAITSDKWFVTARWQNLPAEIRLAARRAYEELNWYVREGHIRLRGELRSRVPPIIIDEIECAHGVLDVFGAMLKVRSHVYCFVRCNADDVLRLTTPAAQQAMPAVSSETEPPPAAGLWTDPPTSESVYRTGAAGKPTSIQLVEAELNRRIGELPSGEFLGKNIIEVAASLSRWLKVTHPAAPQLTEKTISNRLGHKIRPHTQNARN
jgi:hypothetical protein